MKSILLLSFFFIVGGCSSQQRAPLTQIGTSEMKWMVSENAASSIQPLLDEELKYIQTIPEVEFKKELTASLSTIHEIDYQKMNCASGQVACADQSNEGRIFINDRFFQIPPREQFTALLHEARHLETQNFEHAKCVKRPEWGYECDEGINSPYGLEYKYLLHKFINTKDEQSAQVLQKIFLRVNKI